MSDTKIPSGNNPAPPTQPPVDTGRTGALGLGVDVGVLADPLAAPETGPTQTELDRDAYARQDRQSQDHSRDDGTTRRSGENPFAKLAGRKAELAARRLARASVGLEAELDLPFEALDKLAQMEARLGAEHAARFARLRQGAMLLSSDGQSTREGKVPLDKKGLESFASKLSEKSGRAATEDYKAFLKLQARFVGGIKTDIHSFVQRVLRECYLIQNGLLFDYAEKVKFFNALRKKTRELLNPARETKSAWSVEQAKLPEGETYYGLPPCLWQELDDNGELVTRTMTAEEVEAWITSGPNATDDGTDSGAMMKEHERLYGESRLTEEDLEGLGMLKGQDDDFIVDNIENLCAILPKMNAEDLDNYLVPLLDELNAGDAEEEEILQVFENLSPWQCVYMLARGHDAFHYAVDFYHPGGCLDDGETGDFVISTRNLVRQALEDAGLDPSSYLPQMKFTSSGSTPWEIAAKGVSAPLAAALLVQLKLKAEQPVEQAAIEPGEGDPQVGSPKHLRTVDEMEDYIEYLEEKLNSYGEDGQLANIDLQNALQRQQYTLQMMTNMSKMLHDTTMAMVRRIGE